MLGLSVGVVCLGFIVGLYDGDLKKQVLPIIAYLI